MGVVKLCTRGYFGGIIRIVYYIYMQKCNCAWTRHFASRAGATLDTVHSDRREVGGEPEIYTRAVYGAVLQAIFECK